MVVAQLKGLTERRKSALIVTFSALIAVLGLIGIVRHGLFSLPDLAKNKDGLNALQSIVTMTAIIGASIASYYRFFRGRTFSVRADLSISCKIVPSDDSSFLHAVTFTVRNVGTMAIWNPLPQMRVELQTAGGSRSYAITNWLDDHMTHDPNSKGVIDAGETALFFVRHTVEKSVPAVTYVASVMSEDGDSWMTGASFANELSSD